MDALVAQLSKLASPLKNQDRILGYRGNLTKSRYNVRNVSMEVRIYQDEHGNEPFTEWLNSLKDAVTRRRITKRLRRIERDNLGDFASVGDGVFELRLHFGAGYRVYYGYLDDETLLLLVGGDKSTQTRDIQKAKQYWEEHKRSN